MISDIDIKLSTTKPFAWAIMLKQNQNSMTINTYFVVNQRTL